MIEEKKVKNEEFKLSKYKLCDQSSTSVADNYHWEGS